MARRKKHHTTKRRTHRRRIGAIHHGGLMNAAEEGVGLVLASVAGTVIQRMATSINPKLLALGQVVAGVYIKGSSNAFIRGAGWGLMSIGAVGLVHDLGIIRGIEDTVSGLYDGVSGYEEVNGISNNGYIMNGLSNNNYVNGMDEVEMMNPIGR